jgi:hypothetical protein
MGHQYEVSFNSGEYRGAGRNLGVSETLGEGTIGEGGIDISDLWQGCDPKKQLPTIPITFGKLTGFAHTDSSKINGVSP